MRRAVWLGWPPGVAADSGSGTSYGYPVVSGTPIASSQPDQPFNRAVIELDDFPSDPSGHPAGGFRSVLR